MGGLYKNNENLKRRPARGRRSWEASIQAWGFRSVKREKLEKKSARTLKFERVGSRGRGGGCRGH